MKVSKNEASQVVWIQLIRRKDVHEFSLQSTLTKEILLNHLGTTHSGSFYYR